MKKCLLLLFLTLTFLLVLNCRSRDRTAAENPELKALAAEDQAARTGKEIPRTDTERRRIVIEYLAQGRVKTPRDHFNAALVLQHTEFILCDKRLASLSVENYLLAHFLFKEAMNAGLDDARYLVAASLDRYLSFIEGKQKYGTNRVVNQETGVEELVPIDRNTSDDERAVYGVPPLAVLLKQFPEQKKIS